MDVSDLFSPNAAWAIAVISIAALLALLVHALAFGVAAFLTRRRPEMAFLEGHATRAIRGPARLFLPAISAYLVLPLVSGRLPEATVVVLGHVLYVLMTASVGWLMIGLATLATYVATRRHDIESTDNLMARKVITQAAILRRLLIVMISVITLSIILMRFEDFRQLGTGLLASAGVAGLIIGFAAQRTLGNVLAGIQIAITQPIRVDDV
ncbi:MAG: mechanosensitive ion channel protein MscS, partial [Bacteroidota bacterium]